MKDWIKWSRWKPELMPLNLATIIIIAFWRDLTIFRNNAKSDSDASENTWIPQAQRWFEAHPEYFPPWQWAYPGHRTVGATQGVLGREVRKHTLILRDIQHWGIKSIRGHSFSLFIVRWCSVHLQSSCRHSHWALCQHCLPPLSDGPALHASH